MINSMADGTQDQKSSSINEFHEQPDLSLILFPPPDDNSESDSAKIALATIISLLFVTTVSNSLLVIVTVAIRRSLHRPLNLYVLSLCVSDILLASVIGPINVVALYRTFDRDECIVLYRTSTLAGIAMFNSVYSVVAIASDRYRAILRPLSEAAGTKKTMLCIAFWWAAGLVSYLPRLIVPSGITDKSSAGVKMTDLVVTFLLPLSVICALYRRIVGVLSTHPDRTAPCAQILMIRRRRAVRMIVAMTTAFAVCWLPYHVHSVLTITWWEPHNQKLKAVIHSLRYVSIATILTNASLNSVVYGYYTSSFRRALFNCRREARGSTTTITTNSRPPFP